MVRQRRFAASAFFGAAILCLPSAASAGAPQASTPPNARFQIIINPNVRADTFLLDTWTGKIWKNVVFTDVEGDPEVWREMPVLRSDADVTAFIRTHSLKKAAAN